MCEQRVAVRIGLGDRSGADGAARAAPILDNDLLAELDRKLVADTRRVMTSAPVPGATGRIARMGLLGQLSAAAAAEAAAKAAREQQRNEPGAS